MIGVLVAWVVLYFFFRFSRASRSPLQKLPGPKSKNLLVGDFPYSMSLPTGVAVAAWLAEYGPTFRTNAGIFNAPGVVTTDLTAIGHLQRNPDLFIKPPTQTRMLRRLAGDGVLMAEFHDHRRQRRILNPAFSPAAIRDMIPVFYAKAAELRDRISAVIEEDAKHDASPTPPKAEDIIPGARKLDMGKYLTELAFDVIGLAGFDYDFKCEYHVRSFTYSKASRHPTLLFRASVMHSPLPCASMQSPLLSTFGQSSTSS